MSEARERFIHLAEARTTKAIKMLRLISNLSNTSNYSYTDRDVAQIFGALESELKMARRRFTESRRSAKSADFSLDGDQ